MSDLPVHQLVNTPLENLRYRSERLAVQLAASPVIDSANPVEIPSSDLNGRSEFASWGVLIGPRNHDLAVVLARLTSANPPIVGRQTEGALLLDLRTVHPKHDQHLVDVLLDEVSPVSDTATGTAHEPH
jgi:seryl-tRNA(Sec) selenium transferase